MSYEIGFEWDMGSLNRRDQKNMMVVRANRIASVKECIIVLRRGGQFISL